jgi:hypothetical protein
MKSCVLGTFAMQTSVPRVTTHAGPLNPFRRVAPVDAIRLRPEEVEADAVPKVSPEEIARATGALSDLVERIADHGPEHDVAR